MTNKRSIWNLLFTGVSFGLLVTNCTIKSASDDVSGNSCKTGDKTNGCLCSDNATGYQVCKSNGVYGSCVCPTGTVSVGGGSNGDAGASSGGGSSDAGGTSYAGGSSTGEAGAGGEGGALVIDPADCTGCLTQLCVPEWAACAAEDENNAPDPEHPDQYCLGSDKKPDSGQIELIMDCITMERASGLVKRDIVRACGSSLGSSADPQFFQWPPTNMTPATEALMNCMADAPDDTMPGDWATAPANFPEGASPRPWDDGTCAKFSCTSQLKP